MIPVFTFSTLIHPCSTLFHPVPSMSILFHLAPSISHFNSLHCYGLSHCVPNTLVPLHSTLFTSSTPHSLVPSRTNFVLPCLFHNQLSLFCMFYSPNNIVLRCPMLFHPTQYCPVVFVLIVSMLSILHSLKINIIFLFKQLTNRSGATRRLASLYVPLTIIGRKGHYGAPL